MYYYEVPIYIALGCFQDLYKWRSILLWYWEKMHTFFNLCASNRLQYEKKKIFLWGKKWVCLGKIHLLFLVAVLCFAWKKIFSNSVQIRRNSAANFNIFDLC